MDALIFRLSLHLTTETVLYAVVTIFHVSAIVSGQTSCTRVTDPSVLEGNANMILVDHVFYSEITSLRFCGIRYLLCFNNGYVSTTSLTLTQQLLERRKENKIHLLSLYIGHLNMNKMM